MTARERWRRFRLGLATIAGRRRGFFIPYRYAAELSPPGRRPAYAALAQLFDRHHRQFAATLNALGEYAPAFADFGRQPPPAPRWDQDWFPRLDGAVAYAIVRRHRPGRIVEVGSGYSTRFLARAVRDEGSATHILAIDPNPRAALRGLPVEWLAATVPACGPAPFRDIAAGDMLFVDSSHILMPGTDVDFLLNEVVPLLPAGALLHIHDVFLPDDYPPSWAWRGYNEQTALAALIGGGWEPLFASHYVATRMTEELMRSAAGALPLPTGAFESSLWLVRR